MRTNKTKRRKVIDSLYSLTHWGNRCVVPKIELGMIKVKQND